MARLLTIGALARTTGVPVKTIRHYSNAGLLPAERSPGRYRLYRDSDCGRLEFIRLLRSLDFDLPTIATFLGRRRSVRDGLRGQLAVVDARLRALTRTRAVLSRAEAATTDEAALAALGRLHAVAVLDAADRNAVLRETMERHLRDVPASRAWQSRLWDVAFQHLPQELSEPQWTALVELIDLVQNEDFGRRLADQGRSYWKAVKPAAPGAARKLARLLRVAARAAERQQDFLLPRSRRLVRRFITVTAQTVGRNPTDAFRRWLARQGAKHDPRSERFWTLVAIIRGWPTEPWPEVRAYRWLFAALNASHRP